MTHSPELSEKPSEVAKIGYEIWRDRIHVDQPPRWDDLEPWIRDACIAAACQGWITGEAHSPIEKAKEALRCFIGCAYPVDMRIDPRGHGWKPREDLDYALIQARRALKALEGDANGD